MGIPAYSMTSLEDRSNVLAALEAAAMAQTSLLSLPMPSRCLAAHPLGLSLSKILKV